MRADEQEETSQFENPAYTCKNPECEREISRFDNKDYDGYCKECYELAKAGEIEEPTDEEEEDE
jgi:hypothetical protein